MRIRSRLLRTLSTVAVAMSLGACGWDEAISPGTQAGPAAWRAVPGGPLSPRASAVGLWTGREVLLIGGSDAPPCPPTASCLPAKVPPLADGAAFDPLTKRWRRLAESPVPLEWAQGFVRRGTAYMWTSGSTGRPKAKPAFLAYRIADDRWQELPLPPGDFELFSGIVQAGDRIVAYSFSDEQGERPDYVFDPATLAWTELPPDPLSASFDRSMSWSGRELVLFDHKLVPDPGSEKPAVTRAAALDLESGRWRRLPDSEILATGPWVLDQRRFINPTLGGADGGETGNWGRTYPYGGILDLADGRWLALPKPPNGEEAFGTGVLTEFRGHYFADSGWVLDARTNKWIEVPRLDTVEHVTGRAVVSAGRDLFVFGGARWPESGLKAKLLDEAWIWSPPA